MHTSLGRFVKQVGEGMRIHKRCYNFVTMYLCLFWFAGCPQQPIMGFHAWHRCHALFGQWASIALYAICQTYYCPATVQAASILSMVAWLMAIREQMSIWKVLFHWWSGQCSTVLLLPKSIVFNSPLLFLPPQSFFVFILFSTLHSFSYSFISFFSLSLPRQHWISCTKWVCVIVVFIFKIHNHGYSRGNFNCWPLSDVFCSVSNNTTLLGPQQVCGQSARVIQCSMLSALACK